MADNKTDYAKGVPTGIPTSSLSANQVKKKTIVQGEVKKKTKFSQKLAGYFFGTEVENPGAYLIDNVIEPKGKQILNNVAQDVLKGASDAVQRWLFGKIVGSNGQGGTNYSSYSNPSIGTQNRPIAAKLMDPVEVFTFANSQDAYNVLTELKSRIVNTGAVSVLDYYEMIGQVASANFNYNNVGWTNLNDTTVKPTREGFYIDLPKPISLKQ